MENRIKAAYESPQSEIIELKLHGGIAQSQVIVSSDPQLSLDNPFADNTEEAW